MGKMEFRLNPKKPGNYAFFCPVTRLHLTLANPVGYTDRISNYILRAIKGGTLLDVNKAVNLETGEKVDNVANVQMEEKVEKPVAPVAPSQPEPETQVTEPEKSQESVEDVQPEVESSQEVEAAAEEDKKNKRGRKPQN